MGLGTYEGKGKIFVNGRLQAEANDARKRVISNNQKVYTFHKDLAGKSDGPNEVELTLTGAVPVAGYETDFEEMLKDKTYCEVVTVKAGKRNTYAGWIDSYEEADSVNAASSYTCTFVGKPKGSTGGILGALGL